MRIGTHACLRGALKSAHFGLCCFLGCYALSLSPLVAAEMRHAGRAYVSLDSVAAHFGMQAEGLDNQKQSRLTSQWSQLSFAANSRLMHYNGMPFYLGFSVLHKGQKWWLSLSDFRASLQPLLTPKSLGIAPALQTIVLDPGHGGKDQGAANHRYGLTEKSLNLQVAMRLAQRLHDAGFKVAMTRQDDRYLSLAERAQMANRVQADLFLSLHFNAAHSKAASGLETFMLTPRDQPSTKDAMLRAGDNKVLPGHRFNKWNVPLAHALQNELVATTGAVDRGLKRARFAVLRSIQCPAVLLELGFLSHAETASRLRSSQVIDRLADGLFRGIMRYKQRVASSN